MQARPEISVCVPMYRNATTISRCLRSILSQEGVDFEIVVIDDDSPDESAALAAAMLRGQDRLVHNVNRLGLNGNHDRCLELARGTYIQIVHGDDALLPGALKTLRECFDSTDVGLAFAPRKVVTDSREWELKYGRPHEHFRRLQSRNDGPALVKQIALHGVKENWVGELTCVMFRRQTALDAGGFRLDVYNFLDFDFWIRLMQRCVVRFVPNEQSIRHHSASTASARNRVSERDFLDRLRILTWLLVDPASSLAIRFLAGIWWFPVWLRTSLRTARYGPDRRSRLRSLAAAPVSEFVTAVRFRRGLGARDEITASTGGRDS